MRAASRVGVTTAESLYYYRRKYPSLSEKYFLAPNVFDAEKACVDPVDLGDRMRIVYTGGLTGNRSAEFFLGACRRVLESDPGFATSDVIFAGPLDRKNRAILESAELDFVRYAGSVSYAEARNLQQQAHILLTIDEPVVDKMKAMFFPSKILDYFLTGRRILAITNERSATSSILKQGRALVVHYPDMDQLVDYLRDAYHAFMRKDVDYFSQKELPERFNAEKNAQSLIALFETL